jgi:hypothetical protein
MATSLTTDVRVRGHGAMSGTAFGMRSLAW